MCFPSVRNTSGPGHVLTMKVQTHACQLHKHNSAQTRCSYQRGVDVMSHHNPHLYMEVASVDVVWY